MRAIGRLNQARSALRRSLSLASALVPARYELALVEREQGNLERACALVEAEDGRFIETDSDLDDLHRLLELEQHAHEATPSRGKILQ